MQRDACPTARASGRAPGVPSYARKRARHPPPACGQSQRDGPARGRPALERRRLQAPWRLRTPVAEGQTRTPSRRPTRRGGSSVGVLPAGFSTDRVAPCGRPKGEPAGRSRDRWSRACWASESGVNRDQGGAVMTTRADRNVPGVATPSTDRRRASPLGVYFGRMRGKPRSLVRPRAFAVVMAFCASFIGVFVISIPSLSADAPLSTRLFLIGSFGASATLLYGAPHAEFAQPRNIVFGQLIAALMGVTAYKLFGGNVGVAGGLAVCNHNRCHATHRLSSPARRCDGPDRGVGPAQVHHLGYLFVATPVLVGTLIILVLGLAVLNLSPDQSRHYPASWW